MAHSKSEIIKAKNLLNKYAPKGEQLAFINSKEVNLLKRKGGSGKMTKAGIRSYTEDEEDTGDVSNAGSSSSSSSSSSDDNSPQRQPASYRSVAPKTAAPQNILSRAATAVGNFIKGGGVTGMVLSAIGNASQNRTRKAQANVELGLGSDRMSNYNVNNGGDNNNSAQNVGGRIVKLSPTSAEVSQSKATDVTYDSRKTKARGRSMTILTSAKGIGKNMGSVLGSKSLLGA